MKIEIKKWKKRGAYCLFWVWHLIYIILAIAAFLPYVAFPMFQDAWKGIIPWHYTMYTVVLIILPFISTGLGLVVFRKNFSCLLKFFYGFEMPLLFLIILRLLTLRDDSIGAFWILANVSIALGTWFVFTWLLNKNTQVKETDTAVPLPDNPIAMAASTALAMTGLYFGTIFLIFMLPAAGALLRESSDLITSITWNDIFSIDMLEMLVNPLLYLGGIFVLFTATLWFALPIVMVWLYLGQFIQRLRHSKRAGTIGTVFFIVLAVVGVNLTGFMVCSQQHQQQIFTLLDDKSAKPEHEAELSARAGEIRKGLLNAYLAPYRYVSAQGLSRSIAESYHHVFNFNQETARIPQTIFNTLLQPFIYDGKNWNDRAKAKKHYELFFDTPIQKAERETILAAVKHTWQLDGNEAGLLNTVSRYVHLNRQMIEINEHKGVATVSVTQMLENMTYELQEVIIHFSLPEDTVVTGLWLSDDANNLHKFPSVVAPKGASQAVYKAEVKQRVDPALLEKTGPRQYRLRVYPVPAKSRSLGQAEPLLVQFEYQALVKGDGSLALPRLLEKRNIYWDKKTKRSINGVVIGDTETPTWLPKEIGAFGIAPQGSQLLFIQGNKHIRAVSRYHTKEKIEMNKPVALLVDGSYSMRGKESYLTDMLTKTDAKGVAFDWYFCRNNCVQLQQYTDLKQQIFFGNTQIRDQINAFMQTGTQSNYSAVIVLTDQGSYELTQESDTDSIDIRVPVWLVHLKGELPYAYDDEVLDLLYRTKGGVTENITEALLRLSPSNITRVAGVDPEAKVLRITDDLIWLEKDKNHVVLKKNKDIHNSALTKIAAAISINNLMATMDTTKMENLDNIHAIAREHGIVSHYSSMLALVNDRQKEALHKAVKEEDRYEREIEIGEQETTLPTDPFSVPSVPEPEEWALLIIAGLLLIFSILRRKRWAPNVGNMQDLVL